MAFDPAELVKALRKQLALMEDDLRARVDGADTDARQPEVAALWKVEHYDALAAQRTAASWQAWRDERVTQAAVGWLLLTVFARYCEDNALVSTAWIGGPDADIRQEALDARRAYFAEHPEHTDREWLETIIDHFAKHDATKGLVDDYSPLHQVAPSGDAARDLLEFWWDKDVSGEPRWSFVGVDTRFLGDVYQDLSEWAKKTYALLQTPEFVEEFILDQTLEPALDERPLEGFTVIDPTCGSGHFLLGAFDRLLERWQRAAPALGDRALVEKALSSVYGVDVNPFAVAIARFRLLVEALAASGDKSIEKAVGITLNLAAGDSLLWGARQLVTDDALDVALSIEDASALRAILQREHDVVVGNPPYITVKDRALNKTYRQLYSTCHRQYALTVPFMELFFDLAKGGANGTPGWVGQITSNSFMKREFGSKLIEEFLVTKDLRRVIDTSGAYIPGHGTPTVILVGRNRSPVGESIRAILGARGEPGRPTNPAKGIVWSAITDHVDEPGFENGWISVADVPRRSLSSHPWSLSGGGAIETIKVIESNSSTSLGEHCVSIGRTTVVGEDDAWIFGAQPSKRFAGVLPLKQFVLGEDVRDYEIEPSTVTINPYTDDANEHPVSQNSPVVAYLWPLRLILQGRTVFQKSLLERGLPWWVHLESYSSKLRTPMSITFAEVTTHNHFVLDRGGKVFKQTAPVIKLPHAASEDDHLRLSGVLNSSVACFWLKENCFNKGRPGAEQAGADEPWEHRYQFNGTSVKNHPLPASFPLIRARELDTLARQQAECSPSKIVETSIPSREVLAQAHSDWKRTRSMMVSSQEELDWECYRLFGLIDEDLTYPGDLPGLLSEERSFAIDLARSIEQGNDTSWFVHHNHLFAPTTEIPTHLPAEYRELVQRRLDVIESNPSIRLLEKPEYKRRWAIEPWDKRVTEALRDWLLDRVEDRDLWFEDGHPTPRSVAQLADRLDRDEDFRRVLRLWAGNPDVSTGTALGKLLDEEGVPYLAALRYKPAGITKREAWEHTWELQRREDAGETLDAPIPVPPKYKPADFVKNSYWARRGKLDVPKERFISYPDAGRDSDPTMLLGWAGWDHAEQALALAGVIDERVTVDGWDQTSRDKLIPMLAGLAELLPWVRQWHGEIDPEFGESVADTIDEVLRAHSADLGVGPDDLAAWRPPAPTRGRRTRKKSEANS
ncbi:BREX-2 system adenine-specific DNA-methyltransferase PglX [Gordonia sp. NPDC003504]